MYRLLIVEDEDIIRQGLVSTIDWAQWGFAVCGVATDGQEGLEMAAKLQPHLVITDIRMPRMSGLDLLRRINAAWPQMQVIMLTGHEQFDYAFESLNLHASAYVLKIDIRKSLAPAMETVVRMLEESNGISAIRIACYRALIGASPEHPQPEKNAPVMDYLQVFFSVPSHDTESIEPVLTHITEQVRAFCPGALLFRVAQREAAFISLAGAIAPLPDSLRSGGTGPVDVLLLRCSRVKGYAALAEAAQQVRRVALALPATVGWTMQPCDSDPPRYAYPEAIASPETDLLRAVKVRDAKMLRSAYATWAALWDVPEAPVLVMQARAVAMFGMLIPALPGGGFAPDLAPLASLMDRHLLSESSAQLLNSMAEQVESERGSAQQGYVAYAVAYIDDHLEDRMRISDVAQALHLNPAYLSVLFKEQTGTTFTEYMVGRKMLRATALLRGGASVTEAASCVGYQDIGHFRAMYQKHIGSSPRQAKEGRPS